MFSTTKGKNNAAGAGNSSSSQVPLIRKESCFNSSSLMANWLPSDEQLWERNRSFYKHSLTDGKGRIQWLCNFINCSVDNQLHGQGSLWVMDKGICWKDLHGPNEKFISYADLDLCAIGTDPGFHAEPSASIYLSCKHLEEINPKTTTSASKNGSEEESHEVKVNIEDKSEDRTDLNEAAASAMATDNKEYANGKGAGSGKCDEYGPACSTLTELEHESELATATAQMVLESEEDWGIPTTNGETPRSASAQQQQVIIVHLTPEEPSAVRQIHYFIDQCLQKFKFAIQLRQSIGDDSLTLDQFYPPGQFDDVDAPPMTEEEEKEAFELYEARIKKYGNLKPKKLFLRVPSLQPSSTIFCPWHEPGRNFGLAWGEEPPAGDETLKTFWNNLPDYHWMSLKKKKGKNQGKGGAGAGVPGQFDNVCSPRLGISINSKYFT